MNHAKGKPCVVILTLLVGCLSHCAGTADFDQPCSLLRTNPDGGSLGVAVREGELPLTTSDYLSLGSPSCSEACVRDSAAERTGDNSAIAAAYCSVSCKSETDTSCGSKHVCRALLLDAKSIEGLCQADPAKCSGFGGNPSPFFCTRKTTNP